MRRTEDDTTEVFSILAASIEGLNETKEFVGYVEAVGRRVDIRHCERPVADEVLNLVVVLCLHLAQPLGTGRWKLLEFWKTTSEVQI